MPYLNITIGHSEVQQVWAEARRLTPSPQLKTPETITGRLLGLTRAQLLSLRYGLEVVVGFEGHPYRFTRLDQDGQFALAWARPHE